jgi:hypothetical protein
MQKDKNLKYKLHLHARVMKLFVTSVILEVFHRDENSSQGLMDCDAM